MGDRREILKQNVNGGLVIPQKSGFRLEYNGPAKCAEIASRYFPNNRENVCVFDVACGIGLTGIELDKLGFENINGAETSNWMIEKAKATEVYKKLVKKKISREPSCNSQGVFDLITVCGACERLQYDFIIELIRIAKPGGVICIVNRKSTLNELPDYANDFFPLCNSLELEGKWTKQEVTTFPNFLGTEDGIAIVYRKI